MPLHLLEDVVPEKHHFLKRREEKRRDEKRREEKRKNKPRKIDCMSQDSNELEKKIRTQFVSVALRLRKARGIRRVVG